MKSLGVDRIVFCLVPYKILLEGLIGIAAGQPNCLA
jgi:hypothetical protein